MDKEYPLAFGIKADVFGLSVSHELPEDLKMAATSSNLNTSTALSNMSDMLPGSMYSKGGTRSQFSDSVMKSIKGKPKVSKQLEVLNFQTCQINKPSSQKFILKNISGIKTLFNFSAVTFCPLNTKLPAAIQGKSSLEDMSLKNESQTQSIVSKPSSSRKTKIRFANSTRKLKKEKALKKPLLTDAHENLNKFSSATGETFTATKRLEKEQNFFLSNNKGIAVVFSPNEGKLLPHSEIPVTVTIYNNACGKFDDVFTSIIKGLPQFQFPINIRISGSPLVIPENQVGVNYNTFPPTIAFPTIIDNSPQLLKTFKIKNTGIADVNVHWNLFDERDREQQGDSDMFDIKIMKNTAYDSKDMPYKLEFNMIEPDESQNSPYEIEPKECIIPSKAVVEFDVKFSSDQGVANFPSVLLAHPQLAEQDIDPDDEEKLAAAKRPLGIVSL